MVGRERIAIIVLNWRNAEDTVECLESVLADLGVERAIVVDNESDGTLRTLLDCRLVDFRSRVELIEVAENRGFAGGVNIGISWAIEHGFEFIGTINNDARLQTGAFSSLVSFMKQDNVAMIAPMIVDEASGETAFGSKFSVGRFTTVPVVRPESDVTYLSWACLLVHVSVFRAVGLLDERFFMYWEDVWFSRQALSSGFALGVTDQVSVKHRTSSSHSRAGAAIDFYSGFGGGVLAQLVGSPAGICFVVRLMLRVLKRLVRLQWKAAWWMMRGGIDGLRVDLDSFGSAWCEFRRMDLPWMRG